MAAYTVLVVEEGSAWALPVLELLQSCQYGIVHVHDGRSALEKAFSEPPDLALVQDALAGLDGYTLCRRLKDRASSATTRVILMLTDNLPEDRVDALKVGADGYIGPPFHLGEVTAKIEAEIKKKDQVDELRKSNVALQIAAEHLKRAAIMDSLTTVYNRGYFDQVCEREFHRAKRFGLDVSCVLTDLDGFKEFNDTYGHQAGDTVLANYGRLLKNHVRSIDIAARYGGEEFALLLPNTDYEGAWTVAEKVRQETETSLFLSSGKNSEVTASFGVASFVRSQAETPEQFVHCADMALYLAKKNGRNRVEVYLPEELVKLEQKRKEESAPRVQPRKRASTKKKAQ